LAAILLLCDVYGPFSSAYVLHLNLVHVFVHLVYPQMAEWNFLNHLDVVQRQKKFYGPLHAKKIFYRRTLAAESNVCQVQDLLHQI
tara:strand:- start:107 stop:364 length:258 start_codon:yes stop_codon:yes gene_type:complete